MPLVEIHIPSQLQLVTSAKTVPYKRDLEYNINGSGGDLSKRLTRKFPKWVTKNPTISDVEYLTTPTLKHNKKKYKWCIYLNNGNDTWGSHWKFGHK